MKKYTLEQSKAIDWLQINQDQKATLEDEFQSLINDDKDFNYKKSEFLDWIFDYIID